MPGQGKAHKAMTDQVRSIGRQIEAVEDQIDAAIASGADHADLDAQLAALEAQMKTAQVDKKKAFADYKAEQKTARGKK